MAQFSYVLTNRPFGIGCQPDGWTDKETFPARQDTGHGVRGYARLVYPDRVPFTVLEQYEMEPVDSEERLALKLWRNYHGDLMKIFEWMPRYLQRPTDQLRNHADYDVVAYAAVAWLEKRLSLDVLMTLALAEKQVK